VTMAGATLTFDPRATFSAPGSAFTARIPLRCFHDAGGTFKFVGTPLKIAGDKGLFLTMRSADIEGVGHTIACPARWEYPRPRNS